MNFHQDAVVGTVAKMLGNPSNAEDIAQQVFLRLWKSARRYQVRAKFTTFLFTITKRLVFNESRRINKRREFSIEGQVERSHSEMTDSRSILPRDALLQNELVQKVDQAIQSLPEKQRLAVILRRYEEMTYEEIAEVLDLSISAVKSQLFRARSALRESLHEYLDNG